MRVPARKVLAVAAFSALLCATTRAESETHIWAFGRWPHRYGLIGIRSGIDEVSTHIEYGDRYFRLPVHIYTLVALINLIFSAWAIYVYRRYRQRVTWVPHAIVVGIGLPFALFLFLLQFRLLSFSLLAVAVVAFCVLPRYRRETWAAITYAALIGSLFLPIDIAIGRFHFGSRHGTSRGGPHLVKVVYYPYRPEPLLLIHGEYIVAGCGYPPLCLPKWILVWN